MNSNPQTKEEQQIIEAQSKMAASSRKKNITGIILLAIGAILIMSGFSIMFGLATGLIVLGIIAIVYAVGFFMSADM